MSSKGLTAMMNALEKKYGEKVVMRMTDSNTDVKTTSTGRADLDAALGGGYGVGKNVEIYSEEACGKTGCALEAIAQVQINNGVAAFIDVEHALDTKYAAQLGVDMDALLFSQPTYAEQTIEIVRALVNSGEVDLIVIDSVAGMIPKTVLEGESGEAKMAVLARLMSTGLTMLIAQASMSGCTIIWLNQLRDTMAMYGPPKKPAGGNALKFYAYQRLEIKKKALIKEGDTVIGFKQHIKVVKNKHAAPYKEIENDIIFGTGVDSLVGTIEALLEKGILERKGAFFQYQGVSIGQGMKKLRIALQDNPDLLDELEIKLKETL